MAYALEGNGQLWAWGSGAYGQLGDGFLQDLNEPAPVLQARTHSPAASGTRVLIGWTTRRT